MRTWREFGIFFFGTPGRALMTIVIFGVLMVTGLLQLLLNVFIASVVVPVLLIFLLLYMLRYAIFGSGRGHNKGN